MKCIDREKLMVDLKAKNDPDSIVMIKDAFMQMLDRKPKLIMVNCGKLYGIDVSGIMLLVYFAYKARMNKASFIIYDLDPAFKPAFASLNLMKYATVISREKISPNIVDRMPEDCGYVEIRSTAVKS